MRNRRIDILKLLYAVVIMAGHSVTVGVTGAFPFQHIGILTEFFMIVTGYYTCVHFEMTRSDQCNDSRTGINDPICYTLRKFKPLIPFIVISTAIRYIPLFVTVSEGRRVYLGYYIMETSLTNYVFAESHQHVGALWYLAALAISLPAFCILCQIKNKKVKECVGFYAVIFYYHNIDAAITADWPRVILRLLAGMCIGLLVHESTIQLKKDVWGGGCSAASSIGFIIMMVPLVMSCLQIQNRRIPLLCEFFGLVLILMSDRARDNPGAIVSRSFAGEQSMAIFVLHWSVGEFIRWAVPDIDIGVRVIFYFAVTFSLAIAMLVFLDRYGLDGISKRGR